MDLARVQIQTQDAVTGMQQQRPFLSIRQRPADMTIDQELGSTLSISTNASKLFIDQTEAFADANLKSIFRRNEEFVAKAQQTASQYVAKTAQQGEMLKKIENGTNAIPQIAQQNGTREPKQYNLAMVPEHMGKVKIDFQPAEVSIQSNWQKPSIHVRKNEPEITVPRWETNIYLQQKNSIQFDVIGGSVNRQL
ncbi:hypothetical protein CR203_07575 [Salipaludibacillus neizhouensis]|uniref:YviE n=1 Tax=Salipaludibacillus neizhouensis TaxID=885475 RepID=A0A3A9KCU2_9BACI|nr:DUF6470 family protein [Salipaludibacillus neizhouensis]RKL68331.1 hypothetical protein CR203_07575 [Salipaludibacillus neizhouensis]